MGILELAPCGNSIYASPIEELASLSQQKRDTAARSLRETYAPPSRTNWDKLTNSLKIGLLQQDIEKQLQSSNVVLAGPGSGNANAQVRACRLDDLWYLTCSFTNSSAKPTEFRLGFIELSQQVSNVWVEPPPNFTGVWRTYWVNGQTNQEWHYKNGQFEGLCVTFHSNGTNSVVWNAHNGLAVEEETGYYPSGRLNYKGTRTNGDHLGVWIWHNEDGTVKERKDYGNK